MSAADPWGNYANINGAPGSVTDNGDGSYTVSGGGNEMWGNNDAGFFAYAPVAGNFDVSMKMPSQTQAGSPAEWARAGLMVRTDPANPGSPGFWSWHAPQNAPGNHYRLYKRGDWGAWQPDYGEPGWDFAHWPDHYYRVTRRGSVFTVYVSMNHNPINGQPVWGIVERFDTAGWAAPLPDPVNVGVVSSAHNANMAEQAARIEQYTLVSGQSYAADLAPIHYRKWLFGCDVNDLQTQLANNPQYDEMPDSATGLVEFSDYNHIAGLDGYRDNNCIRAQLAGVFQAPAAGAYTFYIASDDPSRLFICPDEQPAGKVEIAREPEWGNYKEYIFTRDAAYQNGTADNQRGKVGGGFKNISVPITLAAGERRYLEAIMSQGGGGGHVAVAVAGPGLPAVANGSPAIPVSLFVPSGKYRNHIWFTDGPVFVSQDPTDISVPHGEPYTFRVKCDGTPPWTMLWLKKRVSDPDFAPVPGATDWALNGVATYPDDDQAEFKFVVMGGGNSATSAVAKLTVVADLTPPTLIAASAGIGNTNIYLTFSELMDPVTIADTNNYVLDGGLAVLSATLQADGTNAVLTTTAQTPGTTYSLTISNVLDRGAPTPNPISPNPTVTNITAYPFVLNAVAGVYMREIWRGLSGANVLGTLTNNINWPFNPGQVDFLSDSTPPGLGEDNYGMRYSGHIIPTRTGPYQFEMHQDDSGQFRLSTDANANNSVTLINIDGSCCGYYQSPVVWLTAGHAYYFDSIMQEGGGGDYLELRWKPPGASGYSDIPPENLAYCYSLAITADPASITVDENNPATFTVGTAQGGASPGYGKVRYQWERSNDGGGTWNPIVGATGPTYTLPSAINTDNGAQFRAIVSAWRDLLSITSAPATLTVQSDTNPPALVFAMPLYNGTSILLAFSEPMSAASVGNTANYEVSGGVTVTGATLQPDGTNVVLDVTALTSNEFYTVTISNVTDVADNVIAPNPTIVQIQAWVAILGQIQREIYNNLSGPNVLGTLTNNPNYPNNPSILDYIATPLGGTGGDNYGMRYAGHLIPSASGVYSFEMHQDDSGRFSLSTDEHASNLVMMINIDGSCCGYYPSGGVYLQAGRAYYFEAIMQEGGGGDYLEIRWKLPGAGGYTDIPSANLAYLLRIRPGVNPTSQSTHAGEAVTFSAWPSTDGAAQSPGKVRYQWERSNDGGGTWTPIAGATSPNYTLENPFYIGDNGAQFRCVFTGASNLVSVASAPATLTVIDSPFPLAVSSLGDTNKIYVWWSTDVDPATATNLASYAIDGGLSFLSATFAPGYASNGPQSVVCLEVSPALTLFSSYTITVQNVLGTNGVLQFPNPETFVYRQGADLPGYVYADFETGLPPGAQTFGSAYITGGVLHLTDNVNGQRGTIKFPSTGCPIDRFTARFKVYIGGGTWPPADGFSFNFGPDIPDGVYPTAEEEGAGSAFRFCVDTYDNTDGNPHNGVGEAPAIEIKWGETILARLFPQWASLTNLPVMFYEVTVNMDPDGTVDVIAALPPFLPPTPLFVNVPTPWTPMVGNFGFGGRTGGLNDNHWLDDVQITSGTIGPVSVVSQSCPGTLTEGESATMTVFADGTPCYSYQWYSNGVAIAGATGRSYTTPWLVASNDNGSEYYAVVNNAFSWATSAVCTLTVLPDTNRPVLLYAIGTSPTNISLYFSEPMFTDAGSVDYYNLEGTNGYELSAVGSGINPGDPRRVDLAVNPATPLTPGQVYFITAYAFDAGDGTFYGVIDIHGNPVQGVDIPGVGSVAEAPFMVYPNYTGPVSGLRVMPTDQMLPLGSLDARGWDCREVQTTNYAFFNDNDAAEQLLAGVFPNQGPNIAGMPCFVEPGVLNYAEVLGQNRGAFVPDKLFPGIGAGGSPSTDNFVVEAIGYAELQPGVYRWSCNTDDGFRVWALTNGFYTNGVILGEFNGGRGPSDTFFDFIVVAPGLYPIRVVMEQGGGGAALELYDVSYQTSLSTLLNDASGIPVYRPFPLLTTPPSLEIARDGGNVVVCWTADYNCRYKQVLQGATQISNPTWFDLLTAQGSGCATNPIPTGPTNVFLRMVQQPITLP